VSKALDPRREPADARWQRIRAHRFDDSSLPLDFVARLAREQGWSRADAEAAIDEYRRYCWLACAGLGEMTPSVEVDEVWHLHLTYTRDYWERWCGEALSMPLHHDPTGGTRADGHRYAEQYAATLAAYTEHFGHPPRRWWPDPAERFAAPARFRRVDTHRTWLLPRPRWPRMRWTPAAVAATVTALFTGTAHAALPANPLDWPAMPFLALYAGLIAFAIVLSQVWRRVLRENGASPTPPREPIEIAYLAGGAERATDTAVVEAVRRGVLAFDEAQGKLIVTGGISDLPAPINAVAKLVAVDGRPTTLPARARPMFGALARTLTQRGLLLDDAAAWRVRWQSAAIAGAVLAFGGVRIGLAIVRDKPFGFLVILSIVLALYAIALLAKRPHRSRAGDRALAELDARHRTLKRAPREQDWPLAVALAGTLALAATPLAAYHNLRQPPSSGDSGSSSDSSSDGSSGGSGCGGCGGGGGD
jgi:uncharacterized protein (TIGR04222 family)